MAIIITESFLCKLASSYQRPETRGKTRQTGVMEYWEVYPNPITPPLQYSSTPTLQLGRSPPRRPQHETQSRRRHQGHAKDRERQSVAAGDVEEKTEKRRSDGSKHLGNQETHAA